MQTVSRKFDEAVTMAAQVDTDLVLNIAERKRSGGSETAEQLKARCRALGLPVSGSKAMLAARSH